MTGGCDEERTYQIATSRSKPSKEFPRVAFGGSLYSESGWGHYPQAKQRCIAYRNVVQAITGTKK